MIFTIELIALAPEIFLTFIVHLLLIYGVLCATSSYLNYPIILSNLSWLSLQTLFFSFLLLIANPLSFTICFSNLLLLDKFSIFIKCIVIITTILTILLSLKYNQNEKLNAFESIILVLFATIGILLLVTSYNFISIYLAIELQSFCFYILAALNRSSEFSTEAGLKYFVLGAFSSGLLLFGFSLVYGFTGVCDFGQLFQFLCITQVNNYTTNTISFASVFIVVALFFKLSAAPFHLWAPDIYEGSATSLTAFFAIVPKISILAVLTRFYYLGFYDLFFSWQGFLLISATSSIIIGTLGALTQLKLKRLLAFSAIGHMGYMLLGFASGSFEGVHSTYIYIIIYIIMSVICFAVLLGIYQKKSNYRLNYIKDLAVLTRSNSLLALTLSLTFFSIAGIPPLAGFFSKMFIFIAAINSSMYYLAFLGVLASVVSCFYYIRIIRLLSFTTNYQWLSLLRIGREQSIILLISLLLLLGFGIYPSFFIFLSHNALFFCIINQHFL